MMLHATRKHDKSKVFINLDNVAAILEKGRDGTFIEFAAGSDADGEPHGVTVTETYNQILEQIPS